MYQKTLLLCFGIFELVSAYCDVSYYSSWKSYSCRGVQSEDLPLTNPDRNIFRSLTISASNLREIPENAFNGFPSLTDLYLSYNKIESVADGAFNGLPNLKNLELNSNDLTSLSLSAMPVLRKLVIYNNTISNLELKFDELRNLLIRNNLLTNLTFLEHLPKLEWLDVRSNRLSCVDEDIFQGLHALRTVYLGNNPWQNDCGTSLVAYFEGRNVDVEDKDQIADSRCHFHRYSRIYSCDGMQSEDLPLPNIHWNNVETLKMSNSTLREIPENAFNGFPSLRTLNLTDNKIESVADGAFNGLPDLDKLYLDSNDLTSLSLSAMPVLWTLRIYKNKISNLELKLDELRKLYISDNLLTNLTFLEHLPKLEFLDVSRNRLSCVDEDIFRDLPLKSVYLGDNPWQNDCGTSLAAYFEGRNVTVEDKDQIADSRCDFDYDSRIYSCDGVQSEDLPLTNLHGNNVTTLKMSNSTLRKIPENAFNGFPSLRTLNLRRNDIESVADGAFNGLPNLEELDLNFNDLTSLSLRAMPVLRSLVTSGNKISSLELKLDGLIHLDIDDNLLTNLTFLEHLPKLESLDVCENRLSCVDEDIFRDLPLKYVYLAYNPWQNGCGTSLAAYFEGRNVTVRDIDEIKDRV